MRPQNFPARKDARRRSALERLGKSPATKLTPDQIARESLRIIAKLSGRARSVRTKKLRGQRRSAA